MSPKAIDKLEEVYLFITGEQRQGQRPDETVAQLIDLYGAKRTLHPAGNTLTCCGVRASCTWSKDSGLLMAWLRLANVRLQQAARA